MSEFTDEEAVAFVRWAEATHPAYLNDLKAGYKKRKEAKKDE
tara:strand:+ start:1667 stop:1792 length:126 start_codon:yes stop_codon:yes gene_type:complete